MNSTSKREKLIERIETHLRYTARHLVKFDSLEETLSYCINSFWKELPCDFVAIILKENHFLLPKIWKGGTDQFEHAFPILLDRCSPNILEEGWDVGRTTEGVQCDFSKLMKKENISTWFTVPLKDDGNSLGFCMIGFHDFVPLITETEQMFVEFGKDIAVAMKLAKNKEIEKKKMRGIKWVNENIFLGSSIEQLVEKIVELACKGTQAEAAYIYLYDETKNSFLLQTPYFGQMSIPEKIKVEKQNMLKEYFPFLEQIEQTELTVPLVVNLRTIGVLHVANTCTETFTVEDLDLLEFLSSHASALLENARLYRTEIDLKQRLQTFMGHQQELVKQTLDGENFDVITRTLSTLFSRSILLFDRFLRPISYYLWERDEHFLREIIDQIHDHSESIKEIKKREIWLERSIKEEKDIGIWPVIGSGDLLGYLAVQIDKKDLDDVLRLTIEQALNVYAIQFIKQKLVMDTKEQVKDSFINKLFEEKIEDRDKIIEYANIFNWNLFHPHRISILTIEMEDIMVKDSNLLDREAQKSLVWEQMKDRLSIFDQDMILTRKGDEFILIVPDAKEEKGVREYWQALYQFVSKQAFIEGLVKKIYLGVGGKTEKLEDYYFCYKQAIQAHKVVTLRFSDDGYALFEELGAYTLLNNLKDPSIATLFIKKYLDPLITYKDGKGADLFNTLRMYLFKNGNWKNTMDSLFIHRSTLRYRLERIQDIIDLDIDDAEHRLNLMIAYKLHDLYYMD